MTPLSTRLRTETAEAHQRIEQSLNLLRPDFSRADYVRLLSRWLGFHRTFERKSSRVFKSSGSFFADRKKSHNLIEDLLLLGGTPHDLVMIPTVSSRALDFTNPSAALGILYVTEGSTHGGVMIAKRLAESLNLQAGLRHFTGYGDQTHARWQETKAFLDAPPFAIDPNRAISSARDAFHFLGEWLAI